MAKKKIILYCVLSAASILSAALLKREDESTEFIPTMDENETLDLKKTLKKVKIEKAPNAAQLLFDAALDSPTQHTGKDLKVGIEKFAYNVNDPNHFQALLTLLGGTGNDLIQKGSVLNSAEAADEDIKALCETYTPAEEPEQPNPEDEKSEESSDNTNQ